MNTTCLIGYDSTRKTDKVRKGFEVIVSENLKHLKLSRRLWGAFRWNQFINSSLGRNTVGDAPRKIVHFLYLPNPHADT
jgi:hypothetical protein